MRRHAIAQAVVFATIVWAWPPLPATAQTVDSVMVVPNRLVHRVCPVGNLFYVGGEFTHFGPVTRGFAVFDTASEVPLAPFPTVDGRVYCVAADGSGGWYLGGVFTRIGGVARANLAHVLASGVVDGWNPGTDQGVYAIATTGSVVYAGGAFTSAGGKKRHFVAGLDPVSGTATGWDANANAAVTVLLHSGSVLYVGGVFDSIGGGPRPFLAACNETDGAPVPGFDAGLNGLVSALAMRTSPPALLVAGQFSALQGVTRGNVAAVDPSSGALLAWDPGADLQVKALAVAGGTVYLGGLFTTVGGQSRSRIAAVDAVSGGVTAWTPSVQSGIDYINTIALVGANVYAAGGGDRGIWTFDAATGAVRSWAPDPDAQVFALGRAGTTLAVAGEYLAIGGVRRNHLAAIDATTGQITAWNPNPDGVVNDLVATGSSLYVGGLFRTVAGTTRAGLAEFNLTGGALTSWAPALSASAGNTGPLLVAVSDSSVYAWGDLELTPGQPHDALAAFDRNTGQRRVWDPALGAPGGDAHLLDMKLRDGVLYVAGDFTSAQGQMRSTVAAFDANTGAVTTWNPAANGRVVANALAIGDDEVFIASDTNLPVSPHVVDAVDKVSGHTLRWRLPFDDQVWALAPIGGTVYTGGAFHRTSIWLRTRLCAIDTDSGSPLDWAPPVGAPSVRALAVTGPSVIATGDFTTVNGTIHPRLARLAQGGTLAVGPQPGSSRLGLGVAPNPARPAATARFSLPTAGSVTLEIFDLAGRRFAAGFASRMMAAGVHVVPIDMASAPPGVYLARLRVGGLSEVARFAVIR